MPSVFIRNPTLVFIKNPSLEEVEDSEVRDFYKFCLLLKDNYGFPMREHFSPNHIKTHLPFITMVDCEDGKFKFKILGTTICQAMETDPTGLYVHDIEDSEEVIKRYDWLVSNKKPYYIVQKNILWGKKKYTKFEAISCPIFDNQQNVKMIISRTFFKTENPTASFF